MKKRIISEETNLSNNSEKLDALKKAITLDCFKNLDLILDNTPTLEGNDVILKATGKTSEHLYHISIEPKILYNTITKKKMKWECPKLDEELKKELEKKDGEEKKLEDLTTKVDKEIQLTVDQPKETDIKKNIENLKKALEIKKIDAQICKDAILTFYDGYEKTKQKLKTISGTDFEKIKEVVQMCSRQRNVWTKLPLVGDRLDKKLKVLKGLDSNDTIVGKFKIFENQNLQKLIRKTIKEVKEQKDVRILKENLVKERLKLILENVEKFQLLNLKSKVKSGFKLLKELHSLKETGLVNENLKNLFQGIYGKAFEPSIGTISEPLFNLIFTKISLEEELKSKIIENINSRTTELISNMEDCKTLSKFLCDVITEEYAKYLDKMKSEKNSLVYDSLMDSVDDEMFRKNLNVRLESIICVLYNKFTENAKNLMVRMSAL